MYFDVHLLLVKNNYLPFLVSLKCSIIPWWRCLHWIWTSNFIDNWNQGIGCVNEDQKISKDVQLKLVVSNSRGKNRKYSRSNYPKEVKEVKQNTLGNFLNPMNPNNKLVENCRNIFEEVNRNGFQYQKYIENWNFNIQYWSYSVSSKERAEQGWERISKTRSLACDCKYTEYMNGGDVLEWSIFLLRPFLGTKNHFLKSNIFNVRNKMLEVWITKNIMAMKWWTFLFTTIAKNYCRHLC